MDLEVGEVCTTSRQAAACILRRSFAILRLDSPTVNSLERSWLAAQHFFASANTTDEGPSVTTQKYRRVHNRALYGYNVPSDAKLLFRSICSDEAQARGVQPWPDDSDGGELRRSSMDTASRLHALLIDCLDELNAVAAEEACGNISTTSRSFTGPQPAGPALGAGHSRNRKRQRLSSPTGHVENQCNSCNVFIPRSMKEAQYCPLDYFLYNNKNSSSKEHVNCSDHIDRGVLICVSLTHVPGLEVLCNESKRYVCPELLSKDEALIGERRSGCSDLVCVMAGYQLKEALAIGVGIGRKGEDMHMRMLNTSACVHRVRNRLERARLSITYELRGETL